MTLVNQDTTVLETLDFEPECESKYHSQGIFGHKGPATHIAIAGRDCCSGLRCSGFVAYVKKKESEGGYGVCNVCGYTGPTIFIPINGGKS